MFVQVGLVALGGHHQACKWRRNEVCDCCWSCGWLGLELLFGPGYHAAWVRPRGSVKSSLSAGLPRQIASAKICMLFTQMHIEMLWNGGTEATRCIALSANPLGLQGL